MEALATWVSEWEVAVGLVLGMIDVVGRLVLVFTSEKDADSHDARTPEKERVRMKRVSYLLLAVNCSWQLLVFGSLKSSPAAALAVCLVFSLFWATLVAIYSARAVSVAKKEKRSSVANVECLVPTSVYTDLHLGNLLQCFAIFGGQVMLYCMVFRGVWEREPYTDGLVPARSTFFFVTGNIVSFMVFMVFHIEDPWNVEWFSFWRVYLASSGFRAPTHWPRSRIAMSFTVNVFFHYLMITVLPLVLMESSNSMEFVKDATSVLFISRIDDVVFSCTHHVQLKNRPAEVAEPEHSSSIVDVSEVKLSAD
eukprot:s196_g36.t1